MIAVEVLVDSLRFFKKHFFSRLLLQSLFLFVLSFLVIYVGITLFFTQFVSFFPASGTFLSTLAAFFKNLFQIMIALFLAIILTEPILNLTGILDQIALTCIETWGTPFKPHPVTLTKNLIRSAASLIISFGIVLLGILCSVLSFLPILAPVFAILWALVTTWAVAWNYLDYPFSLQNRPMAERLTWFINNLPTITLVFLPLPFSWLLVVFTPFSVPFGVILATRIQIAALAPARRQPA
jgi:hypothetical protein